LSRISAIVLRGRHFREAARLVEDLIHHVDVVLQGADRAVGARAIHGATRALLAEILAEVEEHLMGHGDPLVVTQYALHQRRDAIFHRPAEGGSMHAPDLTQRRLGKRRGSGGRDRLGGRTGNGGQHQRKDREKAKGHRPPPSSREAPGLT
jgi:hypothetical protein